MAAYPNSTPKDAYNSAYDLFQKPEIKSAIEELLDQELESQKIVLKRIVSLIEFDLTQFLDEENSVDLAKLKEAGLGWIVKGIRHTKYGTEIYLIDKDKVLDMLAKAHSLYDGLNIEINLNGNLDKEREVTAKLEQIRTKLTGINSG